MSCSEETRIGPLGLGGLLSVPYDSPGLIIVAYGSGSNRHSPRNVHAAKTLEQLGFATLLLDLLTEQEAGDRHNVFDIYMLAKRVILAVDRARGQPRLKSLPAGLCRSALLPGMLPHRF